MPLPLGRFRTRLQTDRQDLPPRVLRVAVWAPRHLLLTYFTYLLRPLAHFDARCERFPPFAVLRVGAAMEVERDSEEGAFVTEDVSAIIKEVRLPGRPTGPRQRSQSVP